MTNNVECFAQDMVVFVYYLWDMLEGVKWAYECCPHVSDSCFQVQQRSCKKPIHLNAASMSALQTATWDVCLSADRMHAVQAAFACICFTCHVLLAQQDHKTTYNALQAEQHQQSFSQRLRKLLSVSCVTP